MAIFIIKFVIGFIVVALVRYAGEVIMGRDIKDEPTYWVGFISASTVFLTLSLLFLI